MTGVVALRREFDELSDASDFVEDEELEDLVIAEGKGRPRSEGAEFRAMIEALMADRAAFEADTARYARFIGLIRARLVGAMLRAGGTRLYRYDPDEVVPVVIMNLMADTGGIYAKAVAAVCPFALIGSHVGAWVEAAVGKPPRNHTRSGGYYQFAELDEASDDAVSDRLGLVEQNDQVRAAVESCARLLLEHTDHLPGLAEFGPLVEFIAWFAWHAPRDQSRDGRERDYIVDRFPEHEHLVPTFANLLWGGRPNRAETSLLGWYLGPDRRPARPHVPAQFQDDPHTSGTHARAIRLFISRIRTAAAYAA